MPIIKSAKKAARQTKKRTIINEKKKRALRGLIDKFKKQKSQKNLNTLYSLVDKMVKTKLFHKNKAGRLKSRLAKMLAKKMLPNSSGSKTY